MHNAPSVMFPVGRCAFHARALALLAALGALVLCAWVGSSTGPSGLVPRTAWLGGAGAALWLAWMAFAVRSWRRSPVGQLRWGAQVAGEGAVRQGGWLWTSEACPGGVSLQRVDMVLDLQNRALLRLCSADSLARWVWVERSQDPVRWNDLRRALVSSCA